jgi:hypothetical protein
MTENSIAKDLFNAFKNFYNYKDITVSTNIFTELPNNSEYLSKDDELSYTDYLAYFTNELDKTEEVDKKTKLQEIIKKIGEYKIKKTRKDLTLDLVLQLIRSYKIITGINISNHKVKIIDKERFSFNGKDYNNTDSFTEYLKLLEVNIREGEGSIELNGGDKDNMLYQFLEFKEKLRTLLFRSDIANEYEKLLEIINKYYFNDILKKEINDRLSGFASKTSSDKTRLINELGKKIREYLNDIDKFKELIVEISNKYQTLSELVYGIPDYLKLKIEDFINYFNYILEEIIRVNLVNINKLKSSKELVKFLNENVNKYELKELRSILSKKGNETVKLDATFLNAKYSDVDKLLEELEKTGIDQIKDKKERVKLRNRLYAFRKLYDYDSGEWKKDIKRTNDTSIIERLPKQQALYDKIMSSFAFNVDINAIKFTDEYVGLKELGDKLISVKKTLDRKEKIKREDIEFIKAFDDKIRELEKDRKYKDDSNYLREIQRLKDVYAVLNKSNGDEDGEKGISDRLAEVEKNEDMVRDNNTIYFDDYVSIFRYILIMFVYVGILFIFLILLLSFVAVIKLIYDIVMYAIYLFINPSYNINSNTLEYVSKKIIRCTKDDFKDDRFYILTEQKQNLIIFNLGAYTIYLLIFYFLVYMFLMFYSQMSGYKFKGNLNKIDPSSTFLLLIGLLIIYSFIHLMIFKLLFKNHVYIPYKNVEKMEKELDELLDSYILIKTEDGAILVDDEFFNLLFDSSKIDKLNEIFYNGIITRDVNKCMYQKVVIYNLYNYLREYMTFDEEQQKIFKQYCTTDVNKKPVTFISLLNAGETKMIRKYHNELPFLNQIPDKNIEYLNEFNKEVSKRLMEVNRRIINYTKTSLPFFITVMYILIIFILNYIVVYIIIAMILMSEGKSANTFNPRIVRGVYYVKKYIYDPILNYYLRKG